METASPLEAYIASFTLASQKSATASVNVHSFPAFSSTRARMSSMFLQMSYCSESFSVGNGPGRETFRGGALDRSNRPPPGQEQNACQPQKRHRENCDGNMPNHC